MADNAADTIPRGLDDMAPGILLGAILMSIDIDRLGGHDRIVVLRAHQRMASHFAAKVYESMVAVTHVMDEDDPAWAMEAAAAEIRAALRLTRRASTAELEYAHDLRTRLPRVWSELANGTIDARRAKAIVRATEHLPIAEARTVVARVIDDAGDLTSGQLMARISRLCMETDPDAARRRYETAVAERRVVVEPTADGTANLFGIDLPPHRLAAGMRRVNRLARSLRSRTETRTMDQLRADVLLDLLEGSGTASEAGRGAVDIRIDLATLAGMSDAPGDLAGYGPVVAEVARRVVADGRRSRWTATITDRVTGDVVDRVVVRRRPTSGQRRNVEARYETCVFPGCRMPAADCDLDHRIPFGEGGPTAVSHLAPLCRHDHVVRHRAGWRYRRRADGTHEWTSRLGHRYTTRPRGP